MTGIIFCIASTLLATDLGYQRLPGGGAEYIVQIEPATVPLLRAGEELTSRIPLEAQDRHFDRIRIVVSDKSPPKDPPPLPPASRANPATQAYANAAPKPSSGPSRLTLPSFMLPNNGKPTPWGGTQLKQFFEQKGQTAAAAPRYDEKGHLIPPDTDKPWLLVCVVALALFGTNIYLGWIFMELRARYRSLLGTVASR